MEFHFKNFHSFTKEPLSLSSSWKEIISVMSSVDRPLSSIKMKCRKNFNCVKVRYRLEANQLSLQREMSKVTFSWNNTCTNFIWLFGKGSPNLSTIHQLLTHLAKIIQKKSLCPPNISSNQTKLGSNHLYVFLPKGYTTWLKLPCSWLCYYHNNTLDWLTRKKRGRAKLSKTLAIWKRGINFVRWQLFLAHLT